MKSGEYIIDRLLPLFVREAAEQKGITFQSFSDDWILRLTSSATTRWIVGYQFDINASAASAIAQDKVGTYIILNQAGIPAIEHILLRSTPHQPLSLEELQLRFRGPFVVKPLDGSGGREVQIVQNAEAAASIIEPSAEVAWAASPLVDILQEFRVIMLDGEPLISYEKTKPHMHGDLKLFNLGLGAAASEVKDAGLLLDLQLLASHAMQTLALRLASVDIVKLPDGALSILEINDGIMMENYARQSAVYNTRAAEVYDRVVHALFPN